MKQAFGLTVLLIGVLVAIFFLHRDRARHVATLDGGTAAAEPAADGAAPSPIRHVSLTRMVPRYRLSLPTGDPAVLRPKVLEKLAARGGTAPRELPADPRVPFRIEVPTAAFKPFLRDLGLGRGDLRLESLPARPTVRGAGAVEIEVTLPPAR